MLRHALRAVAVLAALAIAVCVAYRPSQPRRGQVVDADTLLAPSGVQAGLGDNGLDSGPDERSPLGGVGRSDEVSATAQGDRCVGAATAPSGPLGGLPRLTVPMSPTTVRGMVMDAVTYEVIEGAVVEVGDQVGLTDASGRYLVSRVLVGAMIVARAPGYLPGDPTMFGGQEILDLYLLPLTATVVVRDLYSDRPVSGAAVSAGASLATSDSSGLATLGAVRERIPITVTAEGFAPASATVSAGERVSVALRPTAVRGVVRKPDGAPAVGAHVLLRAPGAPTRWVYTDDSGAYSFSNVPEGATVLVRLPGHAKVERAIGPKLSPDFSLQPFAVKGLYIPFGLLYKVLEERLKGNLDLVSRTELNALVIDVKGDRAWLAFDPKLPLADEINAVDHGVTDIKALLAECKKRSIYTVARIVVFKDNVLGTGKPEWAVHHRDGRLWKDDEDLVWVDPFRKEVWDYNLGIARAAASLGFDEIQLDYLRFPSDGNIGDTQYIKEATAESRPKAMGEFIAYMRKGLEDTGVFLSADLFGLTTSAGEDFDLGVGQRLKDVAPSVDYLSPMVYPSTYIPGNLGLDDPWREPYKVVKLSLEDARKRTPTLVRPWLQHYSLWGVDFGANEFRLEKKGAVDGGGAGWMFWNAAGLYDPAAFDPEP